MGADVEAIKDAAPVVAEAEAEAEADGRVRPKEMASAGSTTATMSHHPRPDQL